ncbi:cyclophilin-like fold protein [Benzoatithermus flavus]|uniref:Cyclophilin-like fold protein n=1 Tax=Benzoatithermus flavus TaxID=3108223 RepID=A0ABU8XPM0_9PROT
MPRETVLPTLKRAMALVGATALAGAAGQAPVPGQSEQVASAMRLHIDVAGATITAILDDGPTARDFASLLPLALPLEDYNATEKISQLPRRLSIEGAPAGIDPAPGDIAYYAPWGNLAIFYEDFGYSSGLVKLGAIVAGGAALDVPGPVQATIRLAE